MTDPIMAVLTFVLAIITAYYAVVTHMMLRHMKATHEAEQAANVLVYFDVPHGSESIYLVVRNVGKNSARNVHLTFDPPLQDSQGSDISGLPMIHDGIHAIPPGGELRHFFDGVIRFLGNKNLPLVYHVKISHSGMVSKTETVTEQTLDLSSHKNLQYLRTRGINELVDIIEDIAKSHAQLAVTAEKLSARLETGIRVSNAQLFTASVPTDRDTWRASALAKFMEIRMFWQVLGERKQTHAEITNLRRRTAAAADEMIVLSSYTPVDVPADVRNILGDTASELLHTCETVAVPNDLRGQIIALMDSACCRVTSIQDS